MYTLYSLRSYTHLYPCCHCTHTQVPSLGVPKGGIRSIERQGEGDTLHPCQTAAPGGLHPATEGIRRLHQGTSVCLSVCLVLCVHGLMFSPFRVIPQFLKSDYNVVCEVLEPIISAKAKVSSSNYWSENLSL